MANIKISEIILKRPSKPKYPQDDKNLICIVKFDNGTEWCPSFKEMRGLVEKIDECYSWNIENDCKVKPVNEGKG